MANDVSERESFSEKLQVPEALTFDDVLLRPMESRVEPDDADVSTRVSKNVELNVPILSAAMDTVTESGMAIGMAREGGLGVLHRNMDIEAMVAEIERVKRADELVIRRENVVTARPGQTVRDVDEMMEREGVSGAPVVDEEDVVLGIISGTDIRPYLEVGESDEVREAMTDEVITAERDVTARDALELMYDHKIERVPVVDEEGHLVGLVTMQGILQRREHEHAARDDDGRLVCGVAVGPFETDRAEAADEAGADVLFIDCAHAHNLNVLDSAREIKQSVEADVVVGNIGTREAAEEAVDFADGLKVGIGPGSICTTRVVSGAGMPQITAVAEVADVAAPEGVPVIADGGIRYSGDAIKAVAAGADAVMLGSYFAGTDEAPGRVITMNGKKYKQYRGMGSVGAMKSGGGDRYLKDADDDEEFVPEGVEAATPYKGTLASELHQLVGGMRSGMGYVGAETIPDFKERAEFVRVSSAGQTEGHPHDVMITDEAPNYSPQND
ncbi:inosine-5'-monophosphate dehydrogenase [Halogeometricum borinquense DSM 11551]|uniref:Inosine-5'-monophosphate dehydrogenase n=2 Tax=Halogeometricum borinquense TaxID=60847 RepID=E4NNQ9_HALBP|nr:IMP dehydrogenase [Halogeometricum borinquense]ADQ67523.1 inosine-5'-monophosphate dehydrogenase [Halogeometricum borinquense DSM 11551]ELY23797.1 inosine-5'-monophosphate dehydrogenase [Halogeometricum borinquense DSM 11551]RYJ13508.1 IMP dehydrogenase [Halogeometricum borinquense]